MAKKKIKKGNKAKKKSGMGVRGFFLLLFIIASMAAFMASSLILLVGMLPTLAAFIIDRSYEKNKTFTIGAMNFAGCFPFLLILWTGDHTVSGALNLLSDPVTITVIYSIAALGYFINWIVTQATITILVQKAQHRIKKINKEKQLLIDRWGQKVSGQYDLDAQGFPLDESAIPQQKSEEKNEAS